MKREQLKNAAFMMAGAIMATAITVFAANTFNQTTGLWEFGTGDPAVASQVNDNFTALANRIDVLEAELDGTVAGSSYKVHELLSLLVVGDGSQPQDNINDFHNISTGVLEATLTFDNAGGAVLQYTTEDEYEINSETHNLSNFSDTPPIPAQNFTYTQNGNVLTMNGSDEDGPFSFTLTVSDSGNTIVGGFSDHFAETNPNREEYEASIIVAVRTGP